MRTTLRSYAEHDDEDEQRTLRALLGVDQPPMPAAVELPELTITAEHHPELREEDFHPEDAPRAASVSREPGTVRAAPEREPEVIPREADKDGFDWQLLAGLVLDAGLNRGRGVGQLVGAYANNREASKRAKQQHALRLEEIAARKGDRDFAEWQATDASQRDWNAQSLREKALGLTERGVGVREETSARQGEKFAQQQDPDSKLLTAQVETTKRKAGATVEGREEKKDELSDLIEGNVAGVTRARSKAATDEARENPRAITPAQAADDARADRAREATEKHTAAIEAETNRKAREGELDKFRNANKPIVDALIAARKLRSRFTDDKGNQVDDVPGLGMDRHIPEWMAKDENIENRKLYAFVTNPEIKKLFGATVTAGEQPRIDTAYSTNAMASERGQREAINIITDLLEKQVRMNAVGKEDLASEVLEAGGLGGIIEPARAARPQPAAANPLAGARELALPTTTGKVPPIPVGEGADKQSYRMRSPKGKEGSMTLGPEELRKLVSKGWTVL